MRFIEKPLSSSLFQAAQTELNSRMHIAGNSAYNTPIVKNALRAFYRALCIFCESTIDQSTFVEIEHFYPKATPPYDIYRLDFRNLHYSCKRCNNRKRSQLGFLSPNYFLDPANNSWQLSDIAFITSELFYIGPFCQYGSRGLGQTNVDRLDLNGVAVNNPRTYLVEIRIRLYIQVFLLMDAVTALLTEYSTNRNHNIRNGITSLFTVITVLFHESSPYNSMLVQNFGNDLITLIDIFVSLD